MQEKRTAQFFGGSDVSCKLLDSVLQSHMGGPTLPENAALTVIHLSPLDTHLELAVLGWQRSLGKVRVFSCATRPDDHAACVAKLQHTFLEDYRTEKHQYVPSTNIKFTSEVDDGQKLNMTLPPLTLASWHDDGSTLRVKLTCLLYTSPSPRDATLSRMPSSA